VRLAVGAARAWRFQTLRGPPCALWRAVLTLPCRSDLTEATLTGAGLSVIATIVMVVLLIMVRRSRARRPRALSSRPERSELAGVWLFLGGQ